MKKILLISLCLMLMTGCGSKEENAEIAKLKEELASTKEEVAKSKLKNCLILILAPAIIPQLICKS